ncbi:reverse transcriptase [Plakobranchus ocellatus]|uniref:Reverse transcriptase n=1 Tax=Plakobranchus ocellatus TaxID=259542 RepID=A0AAV4BPF6_9GAST|nr:reverse transcriptase [Plakobranchus ocellatus]
MLRKLSHERPSDWDRYLCAALFAYRTRVHSSTGFSPFFLLFGRAPRGPMSVMREIFCGTNLSADTAHDYYHVLDLHNRIKLSCQLAQESAQEYATASRNRQEPKSKLKTFSPGNEVLVLLPKSSNKLVLQLQGPYKVIRKHTSVVYLVDLGSRSSLLHVNLLRRYVQRVSSAGCNISLTAPQQCGPSKDDVVNAFAQLPFGKTTASQDSTDQTLDSGVTPLLFSHNVRFEDSAFCCVSVSEEASETFGDSIPTPCTAKERSAVKINPCLDAKKVHDIQQILDEFTDVLTSSPGHTTTVEHNIILTNSEPVRVRPYPLPFASQAYVREEITKLLDMGVIEPSSSAYCSPIVLVKKKDNTLRLCIDFRKINAVTQFDANNIPLPEDLFTQLSQSTFFTSCDFV